MDCYLPTIIPSGTWPILVADRSQSVSNGALSLISPKSIMNRPGSSVFFLLSKPVPCLSSPKWDRVASRIVPLALQWPSKALVLKARRRRFSHAPMAIGMQKASHSRPRHSCEDLSIHSCIGRCTGTPIRDSEDRANSFDLCQGQARSRYEACLDSPLNRKHRLELSHWPPHGCQTEN